MGGVGLAGWAGARRWARTHELPAPLHPTAGPGSVDGGPGVAWRLRPCGPCAWSWRGAEAAEGPGVTQPGGPLDGVCRGLAGETADAALWLEVTQARPEGRSVEPQRGAGALSGQSQTGEWSLAEHGVGEEVVGGPWPQPPPQGCRPCRPPSQLRLRLRRQLCLFPGRRSRAWPRPLGSPWCSSGDPLLRALAASAPASPARPTLAAANTRVSPAPSMSRECTQVTCRGPQPGPQPGPRTALCETYGAAGAAQAWPSGPPVRWDQARMGEVWLGAGWGGETVPRPRAGLTLAQGESARELMCVEAGAGPRRAGGPAGV